MSVITGGYRPPEKLQASLTYRFARVPSLLSGLRFASRNNRPILADRISVIRPIASRVSRIVVDDSVGEKIFEFNHPTETSSRLVFLSVPRRVLYAFLRGFFAIGIWAELYLNVANEYNIVARMVSHCDVTQSRWTWNCNSNFKIHLAGTAQRRLDAVAGV